MRTVRGLSGIIIISVSVCRGTITFRTALFYWLQSVEVTVPLIDPLYHNTPGWQGGGGGLSYKRDRDARQKF